MDAIFALLLIGCVALIFGGIAFENFWAILIGIVLALTLLVFAFWYSEATGFSAYCETCDKEYELEYRYCPMDGTELTIQ